MPYFLILVYLDLSDLHYTVYYLILFLMQTIILGQRKYYNMAIKMVLDVFKNQNDTLLLNGEWSCVDTKINLQSEFKEPQ